MFENDFVSFVIHNKGIVHRVVHCFMEFVFLQPYPDTCVLFVIDFNSVGYYLRVRARSLIRLATTKFFVINSISFASSGLEIWPTIINIGFRSLDTSFVCFI